jgi:hypothetical protein
MARPIKQKCRDCSLEEVAEAKFKSCWNDATCHSTRSHYRNRRSRNSKRRGIGEAPVVPQKVQTIKVEIPQILAAELFLYVSPNSAVHAIEAILWSGSTPLMRISPEHCLGITQGALKSLSEQILANFSEQSGAVIGQWRAIQKIKVEGKCPVPNCPLHRT